MNKEYSIESDVVMRRDEVRLDFKVKLIEENGVLRRYIIGHLGDNQWMKVGPWYKSVAEANNQIRNYRRAEREQITCLEGI